jgi:hypothetical protein
MARAVRWLRALLRALLAPIRELDGPERVVLFAVAILRMVGIGWGLPASDGWDVDGIAPRDFLPGLVETFTPGHYFTYPPFHLALLALLTLPVTVVTLLRAPSMAPSDLVSRKATILRALKDLEHEREIGKLDDADFEEVAARYRDEAKSILRTLDGEVAPKLARAEQIAFEHLKRKGLIDGIAAEPVADEPAAASKDSEKALVVPVVPAQDASATKSARVECAKCATSNEPDATFCKKCGGPLATEETHASAS